MGLIQIQIIAEKDIFTTILLVLPPEPFISTGIALPVPKGTTASVPCSVAGYPDVEPFAIPPVWYTKHFLLKN